MSSTPFPWRSGAWLWGAVLVLVAVGIAFFPPAAVSVAAGGLAVAIWRWPRRLTELLVFVILAVRPSLDLFGERRFGLGPFALNPAVAFGLGVLFAGLVLALRRGRDGRRLWPDGALLHAHLWLFAAYGIGALAGAVHYGGTGMAEGLREILRVGSIVAAFLVVLWWAGDDARAFRRGWVYLVLGLVPPLGVAVVQLFTGTGYLETAGFNRIQGTFSHPNSFGIYLVPFILAAVGGLNAASPLGRLARVLAAGGLTLMVALTYSRTSILVLVAALAVLPLLHARRLGLRGLVRAGLVVLVFAALGWFLVGDLVRERFSGVNISLEAFEAAELGQSENSFGWRLINWGILVSLGMNHPWTGHGAGMTTVLNPLVNSENGVPFNAHDDFVRFFFEAGLLGLVCYVVYGVLLTRWGVHQARALPPDRAPQGFAVVASLLALLFLTAGAPELSLNTAVLYELLGMLGLLSAPQETPGGGV
ncbi:MAG: O-antigen ligase family protein [Gemmatimonadales bacterium]